MPLCGALAADVAYLPASMQQRVKTFFEIHTDWLEAVLRDGISEQELLLKSSPRKSALLLLSTLQGASVVAWALKDPTIIRPAFRQAVESLVK
jgi:TetR/AcrR family transcriptional repressor of nem operon